MVDRQVAMPENQKVQLRVGGQFSFAVGDEPLF